MQPLNKFTISHFENYKEHKIYGLIHELQKNLSSGKYIGIYDEKISPILSKIHNDEDSILIIKHIINLNKYSSTARDLKCILLAADLICMPKEESNQKI
jgi:hypothetical protein